MTIGQCAKTKDVIEPRLKLMWWMRCDVAAAKAMAARADKSLKISPEMHNDTWDRWMSNIRPWYASFSTHL